MSGLAGSPSHRRDRGIDDEISCLFSKNRIEALRGNPAGRQVGGVELGGELGLNAANRLRDQIRQHNRGLRQIDRLELLLHRRGRGRVVERLGTVVGAGVVGSGGVPPGQW